MTLVAILVAAARCAARTDTGLARLQRFTDIRHGGGGFLPGVVRTANQGCAIREEAAGREATRWLARSRVKRIPIVNVPSRSRRTVGATTGRQGSTTER